MFWRMVRGTLFRQKTKMIMIAVTIALGASLATAMINVMFDVGDKVNRELKTYGANITVLPKEASLLSDLYDVEDGGEETGQYLKESELGNIKTIFWAYNIVDYAPYLNTNVTFNDKEAKLTGTWFDYTMDLPTGESVTTGINRMKTWWDVEGEWLKDSETDTAMVGSALAKKEAVNVGDTIRVSSQNGERNLTVKGIINAGDDSDECIYVPLETAQELSGRDGAVSSIDVSALTTPDNELSRRAAKNPDSLSVKDMETWYCTAYVSSIAYQIEEVMTDSVAKAVRQVAESEGAILDKTRLLMLLITILSLIGSALGISNLVTASVMERSKEIGLIKALGGQSGAVSWLVLTEILLTALVGGVAGYFAGLGFARIIGHTVFGSAISVKPMVIPIVAVIVFVVTIAGSLPAIRYLLRLRPAEVLHGR